MSSHLLVLVPLGLVIVICLGVLAYLIRQVVDGVPAERRPMVLVRWAALYTIVPFASLWWKSALGVSSSYWAELQFWSVFLGASLTGWLWSVLRDRRRRRRSGEE
ncbi:MAG: hypothetical protein ACK47B_21190 [Armatimonadota bacterium]